MFFPVQPGVPGTVLVLDTDGDGLPIVRHVGSSGTDSGAAYLGAVTGERRGTPLLVEHSRGSFLRPGLRGHRLVAVPGADEGDIAGRDWSTAFRVVEVTDEDGRLRIDSTDPAARLSLRTEVETLVGGALRMRHAITNDGATPYLLEGLELTVPLPDDHVELLDFTGRHEYERVPQRGTLRDGLWLRESRQGRPGLGSPTMLVAGTPGFGFGHGSCLAVHVAFSGNSVLRVDRAPESAATIGGGELLLPGELVLTPGASYRSPWVFVIASDDGLDGIAAQLHTWQRSLAAHPALQPVTLNVWEAVFFDHNPDTLVRLADLGAQVGVERFVLDDGWFLGRRDDSAGLGDWWVDETVWPDGLTPLIDHVHGAGLQFGLWFEPEMVNPDSELYRQHPDWILRTGDRVPLQHRNQFVLDLGNDEAWTFVRDRVDEVLSANDVDYVKWDHNRDLLDAGSTQHGGAPAVHRQAVAQYRLLADLRARHPKIEWESCASGGGRIDLGIVEQVQRFWTSDMTDALARQDIQRWTLQLVAPEYLGAHVSAPVAHQSGRTFTVDFRAATAFCYAFGIEWDLTQASAADLDQLGEWIGLHKRYRALLHSGRSVRLDVADPAVFAHGVVAADGRSALIAHVQLTESGHNRGVALRIPGLLPAARYEANWAGPLDEHALSMSPVLDPLGPTAGRPVTGAALAGVGLWMPRRRPETVQFVVLRALD